MTEIVDELKTSIIMMLVFNSSTRFVFRILVLSFFICCDDWLCNRTYSL